MTDHPDLFDAAPEPTAPRREQPEIHPQDESAVWAYLKTEPADNETIAARTGVPIATVRLIVRALFERDKVEDSGERVTNASFTRAIVWRWRA